MAGQASSRDEDTDPDDQDTDYLLSFRHLHNGGSEGPPLRSLSLSAGLKTASTTTSSTVVEADLQLRLELRNQTAR